MFETGQIELEKSKKKVAEIQNRLHLAELSSARMLRRVRDAEQESSHLSKFELHFCAEIHSQSAENIGFLFFSL